MAKKSRAQRKAQKTEKLQKKRNKKGLIKSVDKPSIFQPIKPSVRQMMEAEFAISPSLEKVYKAKQFYTNMLTERMEDVDKELVQEIRDLIYDADQATLDKIEAFFPQDVYLEFYEENDASENDFGVKLNSTDEKEVFLEELLQFLKR